MIKCTRLSKPFCDQAVRWRAFHSYHTRVHLQAFSGGPEFPSSLTCHPLHKHTLSTHIKYLKRTHCLHSASLLFCSEQHTFIPLSLCVILLLKTLHTHTHTLTFACPTFHLLTPYTFLKVIKKDVMHVRRASLHSSLLHTNLRLTIHLQEEGGGASSLPFSSCTPPPVPTVPLFHISSPSLPCPSFFLLPFCHSSL